MLPDDTRTIADLVAEVARLRERIEKLEVSKISVGHTGNQWFTIPEPPKKPDAAE